MGPATILQNLTQADLYRKRMNRNNSKETKDQTAQQQGSTSSSSNSVASGPLQSVQPLKSPEFALTRSCESLVAKGTVCSSTFATSARPETAAIAAARGSKPSSESSNEMDVDASAAGASQPRGFKKYLKERYMHESISPTGAMQPAVTVVASNPPASQSQQQLQVSPQLTNAYLSVQRHDDRSASSGTDDDDAMLHSLDEQRASSLGNLLAYRQSIDATSSTYSSGSGAGHLPITPMSSVGSGSGRQTSVAVEMFEHQPDMSKPLLSPLLRARITSTGCSAMAPGRPPGTAPGSPTVPSALSMRSNSYSFHHLMRPPSRSPSPLQKSPAATRPAFELQAPLPASSGALLSASMPYAGCKPRLESHESDVFLPSTPISPVFSPAPWSTSLRGPPSPSPLVTNSGMTTPRLHQRLSPQPMHRVSQPVVGPQSPHARQKVTYASSPGAMRTAVSPPDAGAASASSPTAAAYSPTFSKRSRGSSPVSVPVKTLQPREECDKDHSLKQTYSMPLSSSSGILWPPTRDHSFGSVFLQPASPLFSPLLSDPQRLLFMSHSAPGTPQGSPALGSGTFIFPPPAPFANAFAANLFASAARPFAFGLGTQVAAPPATAESTSAHNPQLQPSVALAVSPSHSQLLWPRASSLTAYAQMLSMATMPQTQRAQPQAAYGSAAAQARAPSRSQEVRLLGAGGGAFLACARSSSSPPLAVPLQKRPSDADSASALDAPPVKTHAAHARAHAFAELTLTGGGVGGDPEAESDEQQQQLMAAALSSGDPNALAALRSHLCNTCGRVFSRSDMLTRHLRLHSGILSTFSVHYTLYILVTYK